MRYTKFSIKNYKGVQSVEIDMESLSSSSGVAVVGLNESGKTTILKAIESIGDHCLSLSKTKSTPVLQNGEINKIKPKTNNGFWSGETKISCWVESAENNSKAKLSFIYKFDNDKFSDYWVEIDDDRVNFKDQEKLEAIDAICSNIPRVIFFDDFTLNLPDKIHFTTTQHKNRKSEDVVKALERDEEKDHLNQEWKIILQDILDSMPNSSSQKMSFQKNIVDYLDGENAGSEDNFQDILTGISKRINAKITKKWLSALDRDASLKEIVFGCSDATKGIFERRRFSFRVMSKQGQTFSLSDRSKGCQWFFSFMLFTEFRKHRRKNTLFLIDEPAANLHASIQEKVADALNEICNRGTGTRVIYSTHSPYLITINKEDLNNIIITRNSNGGREDKQPKIEIYPFRQVMQGNRYQKELRPIADHINLNLDISEQKKKKKSWLNNKDILTWAKGFVLTLDVISKLKEVISKG